VEHKLKTVVSPVPVVVSLQSIVELSFTDCVLMMLPCYFSVDHYFLGIFLYITMCLKSTLLTTNPLI